MHKGFQTYWRKVKRRWWLLLGFSVLLKLFFGIALLIMLLNISQLAMPTVFLIIYALSLVAIILLWSIALLPSDQKITHQMHKQFPELEYSLKLLSITDLNAVEGIQQAKIYAKLPQFQAVNPPIKWKPYFYALIMTALALAASTRMTLNSSEQVHEDALKADYQIISSLLENAEWGRFGYQIKVYPPAYTKMSSFEWQPDRKVPEGSQLNLSSFGLPAATVVWQNAENINLGPGEVVERTIYSSKLAYIDY